MRGDNPSPFPSRGLSREGVVRGALMEDDEMYVLEASDVLNRLAGASAAQRRRLGEADRPGPPRRRPLRGKKLAVSTLVSYLTAFLSLIHI